MAAVTGQGLRELFGAEVARAWREMAEAGRGFRCALCGLEDWRHNLRVGCPVAHPWQREGRDPAGEEGVYVRALR